MKRFLLTSIGMMVLVLVLAVLAFVYVQIALAPEANDMVAGTDVVPEASSTVGSTEVDNGTASDEPVIESSNAEVTIPPVTEPIPLNTLPLSDTQKDLLRSAGIDPDTFVITPEMITCAERAAGDSAVCWIAGDAPGPTEIFSLLRCL